MRVAKQKRKENIAEYILYLYQIEDLIRALDFDMQRISQHLVSAYTANDKDTREIGEWYANLLAMMEKDNVREKGHLQFLINLIVDVNDFHMKLMETEAEPHYVKSFQMIAGLLGELQTKNPAAQNDVQLAIDTVYGFLLLRMKNARVSDETGEAVQRLSQWLGNLAKLYRDFESGDFSF